MHEERDILHKRVIPELNEYAAQYGESVSLCDLRWGVNTEDLDSEEGSRKVLSVCMDEIDRCRPYMIVLLGERYGWIPEPETLREIEKTRSGMNLKDMEKSVTALEIEYGALENKQQLEHTLFYFREFEGPVPEKYGREDTLHERKLSELKERVRNLAGNRVHTYTVSWDAEKNTLKGVGNFAEQITADLKELLEEEWKEYALLTPFEKDQRLQWDFARQKSNQFRAREGLIDQYLNKLNQGQNLLAISGASGSGKSTLIGRMAVRLQEEGKEVLPIFCGSTMFCNDAMDVIRYTVRYIEDCFSLEHYEIKKSREVEELLFEDETGYRGNKTDADRWTERLADMCALYTEKSDKELVILIDALDQLFPDEIRERLRFIPANLSSKVKMVCSSLDNFDAGYHKKWEQAEELLPLDEIDKKVVIDGILHSQGRELSLPVIEKIMAKKGSDTPLYLSLAVQRLVMMDRGDFENITVTGDGMDAITAYQIAVIDGLPENLEDLCMALVHVASEKLENNMAELAVRYIAVSRYGLRETDLEGIFTDRGIEWKILDFTLFLRYMKSFFLLRDDGRWDFIHSSIRTGVLKSVIDEKELHSHILKYLKKLDKYDGVRISEIMYHCWGADNQRYFVQYVSKYENEMNIIRPTARVSYEIAMLDNGKWLCMVTKTDSQCGFSYGFLKFLVEELDEEFGDSQKELDILRRVFDKVLEFLNPLKSEETDVSQAVLSVIYVKVGDICKSQGGKENLEKAEEMYKKSLEILKNLIIEDTNWYQRSLEVIYQRLGDICMKKGGRENLRKSEELYRQSLKILKDLNKNENTGLNLRSLIIIYRRLGDICATQGGKEKYVDAQEMYDKSLKMAQELAINEKTGNSLNILSASYKAMGDFCLDQGGEENFRRAKNSYQRSLEIDKQLAEKEGFNNSLRKLACSFSNIGDIYMEQGEQGNLKKAEDAYIKSFRLFEELNKKKETNKSRYDLSLICIKIGDLYEKQGGEDNQKKALEMYKRSLRIREELAEKEGTSKSLGDLSICFERIGIVFKRQGKEDSLMKAQEMYEKSLEITETLVKKEGTSESWRNLSISYSELGDIYFQLDEGSQRKAQEMYEKSLEIAIELIKKDGINMRYLEDLSYGYDKLGDICKKLGGVENLKKAQKMYEKSLEIDKQLVEDAGNSKNWRALSISYRNVGDITVELGGKENIKKAREMYERSLEIDNQLVEIDGSKENRHNLCISYRKVGDICMQQGGEKNGKRSQEMYEKSLELAEKIARTKKTIPAYNTLIVCLNKIAMNSFTPINMRKLYWRKTKQISEMLYQKTGDLRYQRYTELAEFYIINMD